MTLSPYRLLNQYIALTDFESTDGMDRMLQRRIMEVSNRRLQDFSKVEISVDERTGEMDLGQSTPLYISSTSSKSFASLSFPKCSTTAPDLRFDNLDPWLD